jgi:hypothetical protein
MARVGCRDRVSPIAFHTEFYLKIVFLSLIAAAGLAAPAIADFTEAIKLDPNLVWLYSSRGVAYSNNR